MGRKCSVALLLAVLIYTLSLPVLAAPEDYVVSEDGQLTDTGYSGPLDPLTGLPNRRALLDEIAAYLLAKETITGDELMAYVNADKTED